MPRLPFRHAVLPALAAILALLSLAAPAAAQNSERYVAQRFGQAWPATDFSRSAIDLREIMFGGPPKDGIPAIDDPAFVPAAGAVFLADREPVIALEIDGMAKAYPLQVLMWHEIANDSLAGVPVAVTYCPLCNAAIAFDRRLPGPGGMRVLDFGVSGLLRHSDMVMYDRQTESWWQQFLGEAIVGELTGARLDMLPVRIESFARFRQRFPDGLVMRPPEGTGRAYGRNPYAGYDSRAEPYFPYGYYEDPVPPLARVVAVGDQAWPLARLQAAGRIEAGSQLNSRSPGQASALDAGLVAEGQDVGNVVVQRRQADGSLADAVHDLTFAFAFRSFRPDGVLHAE